MNGLIMITFDGGCKPNPGSMYGSYAIDHDHRFRGGSQPVASESMLPMGAGTNNRAEFGIMNRAISKVLELLAVAGMPASRFEVALFSDSQILVGRMNREPALTGDAVISKMAEHAHGLLAQFASYSANWVDRSVMVERFGH